MLYMQVTYRRHLYIVEFGTESERDVVVKVYSWKFKGNLICLHKWDFYFNPQLKSSRTTPWIHLYNLPLEHWNRESIIQIGS